MKNTFIKILKHKNFPESCISEVGLRIKKAKDPSESYTKEFFKKDSLSILYFLNKNIDSKFKSIYFEGDFNQLYFEAYASGKVRPYDIEVATHGFNCNLRAFKHSINALMSGVDVNDAKLISTLDDKDLDLLEKIIEKGNSIESIAKGMACGIPISKLSILSSNDVDLSGDLIAYIGIIINKTTDYNIDYKNINSVSDLKELYDGFINDLKEKYRSKIRDSLLNIEGVPSDILNNVIDNINISNDEVISSLDDIIESNIIIEFNKLSEYLEEFNSNFNDKDFNVEDIIEHFEEITKCFDSVLSDSNISLSRKRGRIYSTLPLSSLITLDEFRSNIIYNSSVLIKLKDKLGSDGFSSMLIELNIKCISSSSMIELNGKCPASNVKSEDRVCDSNIKLERLAILEVYCKNDYLMREIENYLINTEESNFSSAMDIVKSEYLVEGINEDYILSERADRLKTMENNDINQDL